LIFGVADASGTLRPQKHTTLKEAMLVPFYEAAKVTQTPDGPLEEAKT